MPIPVFETFEIELQNVLNNLYDPVYKPAPVIYEVVGCNPAEGPEGARHRILQAIQKMDPGDAAPPDSKSRFLYQLLYHRFVRALSQERAAEHLQMSARHLRRRQHEAIHALAVRLWDERPGGAQPVPTPATPEIAESDRVSSPSPVEAILHEIEVLSLSSPNTTANLHKAVTKAVEMARYLRKETPIQLQVGQIPADLEIPIHPSVLRQLLLYVIDQILQTGFKGSLEIAASQQGDQACIAFSACHDLRLAEVELPGFIELVPVLGGKVSFEKSPETCSVKLFFPLTRKTSLLVIDDNADQVHLYRRVLANTAYQVQHLPGGENLLQQIEAIQPDIIIMDILLPGIDGWDLLLQLRNHPHTRSLPVIVCSVMGNEDIARSLGATAYLSKPVDRRHLLGILNRFNRLPPTSQQDSA